MHIFLTLKKNRSMNVPFLTSCTIIGHPQLLGINGFTYVLAALITFFLSMNLILGPGWLGQQMGLEGTGTFTQISDSLPDSVDLSKPEFLLQTEL